MGKKKIVVDTNNLISALGWEGKSRELLQRAINREFELIISIKQIIELNRVMDYPKLKFSEEQKTKFTGILFEIATIIDTKSKLNLCEDSEDNMLIECAVEAGADYLISGDDHLKRLKQIQNIKIVCVNDFLKGN